MNWGREFSFSAFCRVLSIAGLCLLSPGLTFGDNWQASIPAKSAPAALVGVDKKNKTFNFFEKRSPIKLRYQYPCVTGQLPGDKQALNDLKTPEGIYFVGYKIANGLDFREYGGIAYTLNYPNPVDKLRGKTGYGIWIHSKGFDLLPTRGCVAINLANIAEVGPNLKPGLPVILAEELKGVSTFDNGTPAQMISLMEGWTNAWASKSPQMFDYYDPEAYSMATEDFNLFKQNKERLFKTLNFIKIFNREIHALEGPGYWVTWAEQLYTASNLSTEGVRRLYWQKNKDGLFRIVGMEWIPSDLGLAAEYRQGKLVASIPPATQTDAGSEAPVAPSLDMPEQAPEIQVETSRNIPAPAPVPAQTTAETKTSTTLAKTIRDLAVKFLAAGDPLVPEKQQRLTPPDEIVWGIGRKLEEPAAVAPSQTSQPVVENNLEEKPEDEKAASKAAQAKSDLLEQKQPVLSDADKKAVQKAQAKWLTAMENKDRQILELYNEKFYNRLPAGSGVPKTGSFNSLRQNLFRDFSNASLMVFSRPATFTPEGDLIKSTQEVMFVFPTTQRQGMQYLWWQKDDKDDYKIVGSQFVAKPLGLEANYLESVSGEVAGMIESWRKDWEKADINGYMSHYLADASQPGRTGSSVIRMQKSGLWSRIKPVLVQLSGLRLSVVPDGIRADMTQVYSDSAGRSDKGVKTLLLRHDGKNWRIKREDWAMTPAKKE